MALMRQKASKEVACEAVASDAAAGLEGIKDKKSRNARKALASERALAQAEAVKKATHKEKQQNEAAIRIQNCWRGKKTSKEVEEYRARRQRIVEAAIADFYKDDSQQSLDLEHSLTVGIRNHVRSLVKDYPGLKCESYGSRADRTIHVFKKSYTTSVIMKNTFVDRIGDPETGQGRKTSQSLPALLRHGDAIDRVPLGFLYTFDVAPLSSKVVVNAQPCECDRAPPGNPEVLPEVQVGPQAPELAIMAELMRPLQQRHGVFQ